MSFVSNARSFLVNTTHRVSQIVSALAGVFLIAIGVALAFSHTAGLTMFGWILALAGLLLMPFVAGMLRRRLPQLQPIWALPSLACSLVVVGFVVSLIVGQLIGPAKAGQTIRLPDPMGDRERASITRQVDALLAVGAVDSTQEALRILSKRPYAETHDADGQLAPLYRRAKAADAAAKRKVAIASLITEIDTKTIPAISAAVAGPINLAAFYKELDLFNRAAWQLERGRQYADDPQALAAMRRLRKVMIKKQVEIMPGLRRRYAGLMHWKYLDQNIDFDVEGKGNRTLRLSGPAFYDNKAVTRVRREIDDKASQVRFTGYSFNRGYTGRGGEASSGSSAPADDVIVVWLGFGGFKEVLDPLDQPKPVVPEPPPRKPRRVAG